MVSKIIKWFQRVVLRRHPLTNFTRVDNDILETFLELENLMLRRLVPTVLSKTVESNFILDVSRIFREPVLSLIFSGIYVYDLEGLNSKMLNKAEAYERWRAHISTFFAVTRVLKADQYIKEFGFRVGGGF